MLKPLLIAALISTALVPVALPTPALAQATSTSVCETYVSNGRPFGYVGTTGVNLGAKFSSIESVTGTVTGTRTTGADTITMPGNPHASMWQNQGYFVPPWGPTGGWKSFVQYLGKITPAPASMAGAALMITDIVDVRFGTQDGIYPGKASVPQGIDSLYVVQRNERGHAPLRLTPTDFNLKICGQPKANCQTFNSSYPNRFQPGALSTLPTNKQVVSFSGTVTSGSQTFNINSASNQLRTSNPVFQSLGSTVLFFQVPSGFGSTNTADWLAGSGNQNYVTKGKAIPAGSYLLPVISNPATGIPNAAISANFQVCVQP